MRKSILILAALVLVTSSQAQDDGKWWKKLFRKKTVEQQDEPVDVQEEPVKVVEPADTTPAADPKDETKVDTATFEIPDTPGTLTLNVDPAIDRLDRIYKENPPDVKGYRVQIYFGDLSVARERRARFVANYPGVQCYLHQAAPNFGVRVGNFTDMEEAYRMLLAIKGRYPNSLIVPDKIEK